MTLQAELGIVFVTGMVIYCFCVAKVTGEVAQVGKVPSNHDCTLSKGNVAMEICDDDAIDACNHNSRPEGEDCSKVNS